MGKLTHSIIANLLYLSDRKDDDPLVKRLEDNLESSIRSLITQITPKSAVKKRKGRGGTTLDYVSGYWIINQLNNLFLYNWDWEIVKEEVGEEQVWVQGKLTVRSPGPGDSVLSVTKTSYGGSDIKFYSQGGANAGKIIDIADDLKSASTDAMKKAASMLGIAADVYAGSDDEIETPKVDPNILKALYHRGKALNWSEEEVQNWCSKKENRLFEEISSTRISRLLRDLTTQANGNSIKEKV